jgi:ABC-type transport system involved in cytochrome c biogenesis permease component
MSVIGEIKILFLKDLKIEYRNKLEIGILSIFSIATGAIIGFVSRNTLINQMKLVIGMIILTQLFLSVFASWKSFIKELEKGTLYSLLLSPISPASLFFSKLLLSVLLIETMSIISLFFSVFFSGGLIKPSIYIVVGILAMGLYLSAVSSFSSVVGVYVESRGLLVPLVILVLSLPATLYFVSSIENMTGLIILVLLSFAYGLVITSLVEMVMVEAD